MSSHRVPVLVLPALLLAGCLVPLPLSEQTVADGGQVLMVTSSNPAFGTTTATSITTQYLYQVEVLTDSPNIAGRLYVNINDSCCTLNAGDPNVTRYSQFAIVTPSTSNSGNLLRYTINFQQPVQPCLPVMPGSRANVIPVLATEGFQDGPTGTQPQGLGIIDNSHFWQVSCP